MIGARIDHRPLLILVLTLLCASPARAASSRGSAWNRKPFGALILVTEGGRSFGASLDKILSKLGKSFPTDTALSGDVKNIQKAVERLQRKRVKKIVAIPLTLSSHSGLMDQNRYIFGIRRDPSQSLLAGRSRYGYKELKRAHSKVPLVLMPALDDADIPARILAARALETGIDSEKESLLVIAEAEPGDLQNSQWVSGIRALGERARVIAGYQEIHTAFIPLGANQTEREKARREVRRIARALRRNGRVIVVPLALSGGGLLKRTTKLLDGMFVRTARKSLLPDDRILPWIESSARTGAELPDMRTFKKEVALRAKTPSLKKRRTTLGGRRP